GRRPPGQPDLDLQPPLLRPVLGPRRPRPGALQGPPGGRAGPGPAAPEPGRSGVVGRGRLHGPGTAGDGHAPAALAGDRLVPAAGPESLGPPPPRGAPRAPPPSPAAPLAAVGPVRALGERRPLVLRRPGDRRPGVARSGSGLCRPGGRGNPGPGGQVVLLACPSPRPLVSSGGGVPAQPGPRVRLRAAP